MTLRSIIGAPFVAGLIFLLWERYRASMKQLSEDPIEFLAGTPRTRSVLVVIAALIVWGAFVYFSGIWAASGSFL